VDNAPDIGLDLTARWDAIGVTAEALHVDKDGTIVPVSGLIDTVLGLEATVAAPSGSESFETSLGSSISVGKTIGQGGMGLIRVATQHALHREVVVKSVRGDVDKRRATAHIVGEARVTGLLEHPNIIPIYDIALRADDDPMIVMKRIEGDAWSDLIAADGDSGVQATSLDRHLEILRQVANAVHYAHSKGVVHRDLKPDNVMLGRFGEVYVLDWGIAVGLDHGPEGLPRAAQISSVAGSPRYMAPEMAAVNGAAVGPATDVYLLGAILHELLTGRPPHDGDQLVDVITSAFRSVPPTFDGEIDEGLAAISRRAMAREPADRFSSAQALREAIESHVQERGSRVLADQARDSLVELEAWLDSPREGVEDHGRQRAYELLSICRFGFNQALSDWPGNTHARDGLQRALERMVRYELQVGSSRAAAALVADLPVPDPELVALAEAGAAKTREAVARLKQLEADVDVTIGDRFRGLVVGTSAIAWTSAGLLMGYLDRNDIWPMEHPEVMGLWALHLASLVPARLGLAHYLEPTRNNRLMADVGIFVIVSYLLLWGGTWMWGWSVEQSLVANFMVGAVGWGVLARIFDPLLGVTAAALALGVVLVPVWPEYKFEIMALVVLVGMGGTGVAWRRRAKHTAAAH